MGCQRASGRTRFVPSPDDHTPAVATYERWLRSQPRLMDALSELCGLDLVCWCMPLPCHGEVLLELANSA